MSKTKDYYFHESIALRDKPVTTGSLSTDPLTSEKVIKVHSRDVYGITKVYPVCKDANHFAAIAGTTTLTPRTLTNILSLGYEIIYT